MKTLEILSSPETGPYWVSPLYNRDSRELLADVVWDFMSEKDPVDGENYSFLDIGGGSGLLSEEVAVGYSGSYDENFEVFADILDMAPPSYARDLSESNQNIELTQGKAPEDIPDKNYDFIALINSGQYFDDEEFSDLLDEINDSMAKDGHFMFNSTHSLVDLFNQMEEFSNKELLDYQDGNVTISADVKIDNNDFDLEKLGINETVESEVAQSPRRFTDYIMEILGEESFSPETFGAVEAFTDIEGLFKCIESITKEPDEEFKQKSVDYPWGVVKKDSPEDF
jgi:hypothetical protein